jgi:hypothetical protein
MNMNMPETIRNRVPKGLGTVVTFPADHRFHNKKGSGFCHASKLLKRI